MIKADNLQQLKEERIKNNVWGSLNKGKLKILERFAGNKILDVGCSKGEIIYYLNNHGYNAYGCDLIKDTAWEGKYKTKFCVADIYNLPFADNSFDTVISFEVFEHLKYPIKALNELFRVTKEKVILSVPNCEHIKSLFNSGITFAHYEDRTHVNFFTEDKLTRLIKNNKYKIEYIKKIDSIMPESLLLYSWYLPLKFAIIIGKIFQKVPFKRKYYTDIVVVISK